MVLAIPRVSLECYQSVFGIGETEPRILWRFGGDVVDWEQSSYDIEVAHSSSDKPNSFSFNSSQSLYLPWLDLPFNEAEPTSVRVRAHGLSNCSQPSIPWSDWVTVKTRLFKESWKSVRPIASTIEINASEPKRPGYFRKDF
ncbi:hypothetical protein NW755_011511 [Fusarium falciforme]|uniref:Uncharacterized protein n=1 Tax=Fusarium falciforme TaxID=195108 RepID=A0A9W8UXE6_9HYPO|nr:hypothetical protein NW755_011511 [Fusarium falciforme]